MKYLLAVAIMVASLASHAAEKPIKKDPASGFWTCNGIKLHMGVDLVSWQNLDDGDLFVRTVPPEPENDKAVAVHGMSYTISSTKNPAVSKFFLIDKSGKKLYLYDDLKFSKLHPCKRDS